MGIFIGNLPSGTTTSDLLDFLEEHPGISEIELVKRFTEQGEVRYGHVLLSPSAQPENLIAKQQHKDLYGSPVVVRHFVERSSRNDRRVRRASIGQGKPLERRQSDRRWK